MKIKYDKIVLGASFLKRNTFESIEYTCTELIIVNPDIVLNTEIVTVTISSRSIRQLSVYVYSTDILYITQTLILTLLTNCK